MSAFRDAAAVFNKCCQHACEISAQDDDPEASWMLEQLRSELERIEALGDTETSLWSATVNDTNGGFLKLY